MIFAFFFFKQKTAYEIASCLVGSEMCIRDSHFAKTKSYHVAKCDKVTPEASALDKKVLRDFEAKRAATRKRKAEDAGFLFFVFCALCLCGSCSQL